MPKRTREQLDRERVVAPEEIDEVEVAQLPTARTRTRSLESAFERERTDEVLRAQDLVDAHSEETRRFGVTLDHGQDGAGSKRHPNDGCAVRLDRLHVLCAEAGRDLFHLGR
jgi:hypothetical protein